jgi:hypothetical protein
MSNQEMSNQEMSNPIPNHIELRYTVPSLDNKLNMMNIIESVKDKKQNKIIMKNLVKNSSITGSNASPSQYYHKKDEVNDTTANAYRHHTSSHYVMAGGVQFQRGCRLKGVVSRHSRQAAIRNGKQTK